MQPIPITSKWKISDADFTRGYVSRTSFDFRVLRPVNPDANLNPKNLDGRSWQERKRERVQAALVAAEEREAERLAQVKVRPGARGRLGPLAA